MSCGPAESKPTGCGLSFLSCAASAVPQSPNITASALSLRRAPIWRTPCWATARSVQEDGTRHRSAVAYCDLPIFGSPDDMKFRSCATLFALVSAERDNPFQRALDRWCDGPPDERTLA